MVVVLIAIRFALACKVEEILEKFYVRTIQNHRRLSAEAQSKKIQNYITKSLTKSEANFAQDQSTNVSSKQSQQMADQF